MKQSLKYMILMFALAAAFTSCRKEILPMDDVRGLIEADDRICGDDVENTDDSESDDSCNGGDIITGGHGDEDGDDGINDGDGDDEDDEGGERRATH